MRHGLSTEGADRGQGQEPTDHGVSGPPTTGSVDVWLFAEEEGHPVAKC
jgi:hypothetical protein